MAESELPPFAQATAGACGSLVSNTVVYPLDLLSTRLQTQSKGKGSKGVYLFSFVMPVRPTYSLLTQ